ncbi:MAG TPA: TerC family protein [Burkholderiaceae bacterium]|nr:TerC family protein [Burkholderiaceae bacterium]
MDVTSPLFWFALGQIIVADLLLAGDNAVVIALAARSLPPDKQKKAIMIGALAAVAMRVALTVVAAQLLTLPLLKLVGAVLLFYIAVSLVVPSKNGGADAHSDKPAASTMFQAVRTILIADVVMSVDNVIAVAAAARGDTFLLILGLLISIPLVVYGSTLLLRLIERFPIIIWGGAALLGFVAGELLVTDPFVLDWMREFSESVGVASGIIKVIAGLIGGILVLLLASAMLRRRQRGTAAAG